MPNHNSSPTHQGLLSDLDRRFRAPLMAYFLRRTASRQDAEDLTQDTFARLLASVSQFQSPAQVQSYVFRIAANLLRDRGRRQAVRRQKPFSAFDHDIVDFISNLIVEGREPERVLIGQESLAEVYEVLEGLEERTRNIFILYRLEGMKHKEIAALLGLGLSTVEKHSMIAMAALAARFPGHAR
jgi:RNA polymerase sigma-70 factor (ECF subfamily)